MIKRKCRAFLFRGLCSPLLVSVALRRLSLVPLFPLLALSLLSLFVRVPLVLCLALSLLSLVRVLLVRSLPPTLLVQWAGLV